MQADPTQAFSDLTEFIPGSKKKLEEDRAARDSRRKPKKEKKTGWDRHPIIRSVPPTGENVEFFTIGALCDALGKQPQTIRKWIAKGWLPKARYRLPVAPGTLGDKGKRLWSRAEIEGILSIAQEEGIVRSVDDSGFNVNYIPDIQGSKFVERVWKFWKETAKK